MKTTLNADGEIGIPDDIRRADQLAAGDSFDLQRLTAGHYLLTKSPAATAHFVVATAADGLPVIRGDNGVITSRLVKETEHLFRSAAVRSRSSLTTESDARIARAG